MPSGKGWIGWYESSGLPRPKKMALKAVQGVLESHSLWQSKPAICQWINHLVTNDFSKLCHILPWFIAVENPKTSRKIPESPCFSIWLGSEWPGISSRSSLAGKATARCGSHGFNLWIWWMNYLWKFWLFHILDHFSLPQGNIFRGKSEVFLPLISAEVSWQLFSLFYNCWMVA